MVRGLFLYCVTTELNIPKELCMGTGGNPFEESKDSLQKVHLDAIVEVTNPKISRTLNFVKK